MRQARSACYCDKWYIIELHSRLSTSSVRGIDAEGRPTTQSTARAERMSTSVALWVFMQGAHVRTSAVSVAAHGHQISSNFARQFKVLSKTQPGASDHNSTRCAAGSRHKNTVNSTLSLTKATPYSTRATEKIPAPLWPLRWCRPSSPAVKNQPSSLTVQPRPLHLSLCCFWRRPLMMKHRARRQCQLCLAHRLDVCEAYLHEDAHDSLAGLHPATLVCGKPPRLRRRQRGAAAGEWSAEEAAHAGPLQPVGGASHARCRISRISIHSRARSRRLRATGAEATWPSGGESVRRRRIGRFHMKRRRVGTSVLDCFCSAGRRLPRRNSAEPEFRGR